MKILERYILKENFKPFMTALVIITFVLLLDRAIDLLSMIIEKKLDAMTIAKLFGLSMPFLLAMAVPMAVLMGAIMSFGRLSVDREIMACKACGINVYKLMSPTLITALLISIFMVHFNTEILPNTNHVLRNLVAKIQYRKPATAIKTNTFNKLKDYTIFARDRDDKYLYGLVIYNNQKPDKPQTIIASKGEIFLMDGGNSMQAVLYDGEMHELDKRNISYSQVTEFKKFILNLPDLGYSATEINFENRGDRELTNRDILQRIDNYEAEIIELNNDIASLQTEISQLDSIQVKTTIDNRDLKRKKNQEISKNFKMEAAKKQIRQYKVEYHKKYALAFACLIFVMIGVPVGLMTKTSGVGVAFSVSTIVFIIYYAFLLGGEELADSGLINAFLAMWIANFVFFSLGVYLIIITMRGEEILNLQSVKEFFQKLIKKLPV